MKMKNVEMCQGQLIKLQFHLAVLNLKMSKIQREAVYEAYESVKESFLSMSDEDLAKLRSKQ